MLNFYKTADYHMVASLLSTKISHQLSNGRVLWLVGGGSVMDAAIEAVKSLNGHQYLSNLTVSLTDERFGPAGHADSNWKQLLDKGFLLEGATLKPVLEDKNLSDTATSYSDWLERQLANGGYSIALGGIGADGHILGIKPGSPAVDSRKLVLGYKWQDYSRITPTIQLIKQIDEIMIYAHGAEKHDQLDRIEEEASADQQPAQLLKQAKRVSIYNDYKGEKV